MVGPGISAYAFLKGFQCAFCELFSRYHVGRLDIPVVLSWLLASRCCCLMNIFMIWTEHRTPSCSRHTLFPDIWLTFLLPRWLFFYLVSWFITKITCSISSNWKFNWKWNSIPLVAKCVVVIYRTTSLGITTCFTNACKYLKTFKSSSVKTALCVVGREQLASVWLLQNPSNVLLL